MNIRQVKSPLASPDCSFHEGKGGNASALAKYFDAKHRVLFVRDNYEDLEEERCSTDRLDV